MKGDPGNEKDGIPKAIRDAKVRDAITVDFAPVKESRIGELAAKFDIVLGITPPA
jgi:protocatechuate 3,4-dioxygenase, beta subunit